MKKLFLLTLTTTLLTACNTMEGLGTDIKNMGYSLEQKAAAGKQDNRPNRATKPGAYNYQHDAPATYQATPAPVTPVEQDKYSNY